jgi:hypothetical protein
MSETNENSPKQPIPPSPPTDEDDSRHIILRHPYASGALIVAVVAGALLGYFWIPDDMSTPRRIIGGALGGWGAWLCVWVGRVLD